MNDKVKIPGNIKAKITISLFVTAILFISLYVAIFFIGRGVSLYFEFGGNGNATGIVFVALASIPLLIVLFSRTKEFGYEPKEKEFPELFKLVKEVADEFDMEMPYKIHIIPTDEIFVTGVFRKRLGIGIMALRAISKKDLKAILRHEFGHFSGNDTFVGAILARIQLSIEKSGKFGKNWWDAIPAIEFAIIGLFIQAFFKLFSFLFRIIISIYSRQVEFRADYVASKKSGEEEFANALINYSAYSVYFNHNGYDGIASLLQEGKVFLNVYDTVYQQYSKEDAKKIKKFLFEVDKGGIFSSHPSLKRRLKRMKLKQKDVEVKNKIKDNSMSLIKDRKQMEEEFTQGLTNNMHVNLLYIDAVQREGRCRHCGRQFEKLDELLAHEQTCGLEEYDCSACGETFYVDESNGKPDKATCPHCGKSASLN